MNPAVYIIATLVAVICFAILVTAAYYVYDLSITLRKLALSLDELSAQLTGLPWNLRGIVPAITALASELPKHTAQLQALVDVIQSANQPGPPANLDTTPQAPPPPFDASGPDTNWNTEIPPRLNLRDEEP